MIPPFNPRRIPLFSLSLSLCLSACVRALRNPHWLRRLRGFLFFPTPMNRRCLSLQPFHIPSSCRQPRSQGSRARPLRGHEDGLPGTSSTTTSDDATQTPVSAQGDEDLCPVQCGTSLDTGLEGNILKPAEAEPAATCTMLATYSNGHTDQQNRVCLLSNLTAEPLSTASSKSLLKVAGSLGSHVAPGSVVWAKTAYHEWWPAEVMDRRAALECSSDQCDGLVLIQLYGVYEYAWVDPLNNLSQFDYCYEERSKDPSEAFQDALAQALRRKETTSSSEQSDEKHDKWSMLSRCITNNGPVREEKGKRKRKAKVHFDDLTVPENSVRRMRRMKIMRYLGLTPPVGSPFSRSHTRHRS